MDSEWTSSPDYSDAVKGDEAIIMEAKKRYRLCEEWEAQARVYYDLDVKFSNGDSRNMFQWDEWVIGDRVSSGRPCLTINKTNQHNLLIINDAKQNKPGINIRPVGESASYEAAQVYMEVIRHIEYISSAENVYDSATVTQVQGGIGYWRVHTNYISPKSKAQEIYIKRVKDPRSVYLDPEITEVDGSDARFGFVFEDSPRDLYNANYPRFKNVGGSSVFNNQSDGWQTKDSVRVAEYYRKTQKPERACSFTDPATGELVEEFYSLLTAKQKQYYDAITDFEKDLPEDQKTASERPSISDTIEWYKIAGNTIIDRGPWLGKYVPIIRLIGTETVIDGILDRKGHTRALLDAQRMYNINTSANVEFGALQTKVPWLAPMAAVEGLEEYWKTANMVNHAWLPWNHVDDDGNPIPPPVRPAAPQAGPGYVQQMQIAQNEMMMVSGQYQAQMGENENAKSGVAINARQRQGDRATYHFIDNLAIAVRFTGKILIDLIPKIYDTPRVHRIASVDGKVMDVQIDTKAPAAYHKIPTPEGHQPKKDKQQEIENIIFNPSVGIYDVQSDTGPSFATRRQEAFNALTQIAQSNKDFMQVAGDLLWKVADFPEAQALAERYRKIIPKNITGDAPDPHTEQLMHQASDHIQQLQSELQILTTKYGDKTRELDIKAGHLALDQTRTAVSEIRADFDAMSKRITALGNSGPAFSIEQIMPLLKQTILEALASGGPTHGLDHLPGIGEGGTPVVPPIASQPQQTVSA
jgi:Phage P22-like portal protein